MTKLNRRLLLITFCSLLPACGADPAVAPAESNGKVVLVTGATGTQGGAVARELLQRGYGVRGLTRNPDSERATALAKLGAEMVKGDYDDIASLDAAMARVDGVFAMTDFWNYDYATEIEHGKRLVDAAQRANVPQFVFTSVASANVLTGIPHFDSKGAIEEYLVASGLPYSIVRPVSFMDNIHYARPQIMSGVWIDPRSPETKHQWIAASDIGFFVGEAFDNPDDWLGQAVDIAGDEMTVAEFTDVLSYTMGLDVHHQQITWATYEEQAGAEMTLMTRWFEDKGYDVDVAALRQRYPNLQTYQQFLTALGWDDN